MVWASTSAYGQIGLDFGIKAGINSSNIKVDDINDAIVESVNGSSSNFGYHAGAFARLDLLFLYVQPELLYTNINGKVTVVEKTGGSSDYDYNQHRMDIPIMVGFKLGPAGLFAGPILSYNLQSPSEIFESTYKAGTWGYQVGAGVKLLGILAELKYEGNFGSSADQATIPVGGTDYTFDIDKRTPQVILSLGYAF
ncbi:MAG: porin family protein [Schleiferiaceae bacterium]